MRRATVLICAAAFIIAMLAVAAACALSPSGQAEQRYFSMNRAATTYVDEETGVVYFMIEQARGLSNMMVVTPRYLPDGTLYTVNVG